MKTNLIDARYSMPGRYQTCLFYIETFIRLKDEYKCSKHCAPALYFYIVDNLQYEDNEHLSLENGCFVHISSNDCKQEKKYFTENHNLSNSPTTMREIIEFLNKDSLTWKHNDIIAWLPIENMHEETMEI